jgi:uncharacterized protein (DUF983 family)
VENAPDLSIPLLLKRAIRERCPKCGQGKLYTSYLKQVNACAVCGEDFSGIRAEDGPAWLTILIVLHIVVTSFIAFRDSLPWPDWVVLTLWLGLTTVLTLALLPRAKAIFIAMIWRHKKLKKPNRNWAID